MSRSYKKTPVFKSTNCKKLQKRRANKLVRKAEIVDDGSFYKRIGDSWDINDYVISGFNHDLSSLDDFDKTVGRLRK
jgi:hypothetical protein